jgi:hypothetical protein
VVAVRDGRGRRCRHRLRCNESRQRTGRPGAATGAVSRCAGVAAPARADGRLGCGNSGRDSGERAGRRATAGDFADAHDAPSGSEVRTDHRRRDRRAARRSGERPTIPLAASLASRHRSAAFAASTSAAER